MRKTVAGILCLLVLLSGCTPNTTFEKPITFYYCSSSYQYESGDAAINPETREGADLTSLDEILQLYLAGPEAEELVSPFPNGLRLISCTQEDDTLFLVFSEELAELTNLSLSMACGCITMTCLTLTDADQITIESVNSLLDGQKSITMSKDSLVLSDQSGKGK